MDEIQDPNSAAAVPDVCRSCRFGSGPLRDCILIEGGRLDRLVAEGPCAIEADLTEAAAGQITRAGQDSAFAEDRKDALLALLSDRQSILKNLGISRLPEFRNWLEAQLAALVEAWLEELPSPVAEAEPDPPAVVPVAVEEEAAPIPSRPQPTPVSARPGQPRCGACRHFRRDGDGRCGLEYIGADATNLRPNPWWSAALDRATDPAQLEPPCPAFEGHEPGALDPFAGLIGTRPAASRRDEAARLVCLALDRLASRDEISLRAASVLQAHALEGIGLEELAQRTGLSEDSLRRLVDRARSDLTEILAAELREGRPDER